jgi:hypothetical protein
MAARRGTHKGQESDDDEAQCQDDEGRDRHGEEYWHHERLSHRHPRLRARSAFQREPAMLIGQALCDILDDMSTRFWGCHAAALPSRLSTPTVSS